MVYASAIFSSSAPLVARLIDDVNHHDSRSMDILESYVRERHAEKAHA